MIQTVQLAASAGQAPTQVPAGINPTPWPADGAVCLGRQIIE